MLNFENKGITIHFDDYEVEEDGATWSQICSYCRERYSSVLENRARIDGGAMGTCGIYGCNSEADDYVDFIATDKISKGNFKPAVSDKYATFEDEESLAKHLYDTMKKGNVYSIYGWDEQESRWHEEVVVAKVSSAMYVDHIIANPRLGYAIPFVYTMWDEKQFVNTFANWLRDMFNGERLALVPPIAKPMQDGLAEQLPQLRQVLLRKICFDDLRKFPLVDFAQWFANQQPNVESDIGFAVDFFMEGSRTVKDCWFNATVYPLGNENVAIVTDFVQCKAMNHGGNHCVKIFVEHFTAAIRETGITDNEVRVTPVIANRICATMMGSLDAEAFLAYIKKHYRMDFVVLENAENALRYATEKLSTSEEKWDFIEAFLKCSGIALSRQEIQMFK